MAWFEWWRAIGAASSRTVKLRTNGWRASSNTRSTYRKRAERRSRLGRRRSGGWRRRNGTPSESGTGAAPSIDFAAPVPLSLGVPFLLRQPPLLRRPSRLRRSARFRYVERVFDEARQPFVRSLTVLLLAAPIARHHSNHAIGVEPRGELDAEPLAFLLGHGSGAIQVPKQLDARRRCVHVLAARPP